MATQLDITNKTELKVTRTKKKKSETTEQLQPNQHKLTELLAYLVYICGIKSSSTTRQILLNVFETPLEYFH